MYTGKAIDELIEMVQIAEQHTGAAGMRDARESEPRPALVYESRQAEELAGVA